MNMPSASAIAKKTKNEIIEEYSKLLENIEDAKTLSKAAYGQQNMQLVANAKELDPAELEKAGAEFVGQLEQDNKDYLNRIAEFRKKLLAQINLEIAKFEELQAAVEAAKLLLKNSYNIEVAAETLQTVVENHQAKKKETAEELNKIRFDFEQERAAVKAAWEREKEEYEYQFTQRKLRDQEALKAEAAKNEKVWLEREAKLKAEETETRRLKELAEKLPETLELELTKQEKEITEKLKREQTTGLNFKEQEWNAKEQISKLKIEGLEMQIKRLESDILVLKKEQEQANRKAQEMAIKVIESGTVNFRKTEEAETNYSA